MNAPEDLRFPDSEWTAALVQAALKEDIGAGDASSEVAIDAGVRATGVIRARRPGLVAGLPLVERVFAELDPEVAVIVLMPDGSRVKPGQTVARLTGSAVALLAGERTALNFLQQLSGIATLTAQYVARVAGTGCRILDTRKTMPGYRALAKYAVRAGGGHNHRLGLYDRVMIKDNHWAAAGCDIAQLVARSRRLHPDLVVEVEVDSLEQLDLVLPLGVEWILLDNFEPSRVAEAVRRRDAAGLRGRCLLEASGNVDLETVASFAAAGVDAVSVGRLTHSAPALDLGLDLDLRRSDDREGRP